MTPAAGCGVSKMFYAKKGQDITPKIKNKKDVLFLITYEP